MLLTGCDRPYAVNYVTEGSVFLVDFGVPYIWRVMLAVGRRLLYALVVIFPASASSLRSGLSAFSFASVRFMFKTSYANKIVIFSSYLSMSKSTVVLPFAARMIVIVSSFFFSVLMSNFSAFVMLLLGGFVCLSMPATVFRSFAFFP